MSHQLAPLKAITHFYYRTFTSETARSVREFMKQLASLKSQGNSCFDNNSFLK